jgi:ankyrin repeat protein
MCNTEPSQGTDINTKNEKNQTALTVAVDTLISLIQAKKMFNISVIQLLLLKNADPNVSYENGDTAFIKAIKTSYVPLVTAFLENSKFPIDHNCQNKSKSVELLEKILH